MRKTRINIIDPILSVIKMQIDAKEPGLKKRKRFYKNQVNRLRQSGATVRWDSKTKEVIVARWGHIPPIATLPTEDKL